MTYFLHSPFLHPLTVLAASPPPPTQRSPLLYAFWVLEAAIVILVVYFIARFIMRKRAGRSSRGRSV